MATFLDLPKHLREKIYRLHLVYDEPITNKQHHKIVKHNSRRRRAKKKSSMPPICTISPKIEKEAAPIYYGENHFDLGHMGEVNLECKFFNVTPRRHLKYLRSVTCTWDTTGFYSYYGFDRYGGYGMVTSNWRRLSTLKSLVELNIRVDEASIIKSMSISRGVRQQANVKEEVLTPQQSLAIFRFPGVAGLLSISGVENVNFIQLENDKGEKSGGLIAGGPLETHILPRLRTSNLPPKRFLKNRPFRLLDLPPELRNRIYDLILRIPGPIHPSKEAPTTAPRNPDRPKVNESKNHESALNLLLVNKQIHDESVGLFYANAFIFYYPAQFHAFFLGIGEQRTKLIRDLTIDYHNLKCGGIDMIDLTFPLLKQLPGLRRLHVIMKSQLHETTLRQGWLKSSGGWRSQSNLNLKGANPNSIPGIKHLFELRGVTDIKIRDLQLEKKATEAEKQPGYPDDFPRHTDNWVVMQLCRVYEHFNKALAAAQEGDINKELLTDEDWHTKEDFPPVEIVVEVEDTEDKAEEEDEGDGNVSDDDTLTELSDADFPEYDLGLVGGRYRLRRA
ncbi:hypothetical protein PRZ48_006395 [Zasmidium cellare]|uniref:Uncharacterized protein n=1 Tax=Zasmidium cellare TaxID=395010 RepID=A0ABR0EP56_ZASCE|nr:hypothetical protein PRZ48_006395 [Zasmidium cellare]